MKNRMAFGLVTIFAVLLVIHTGPAGADPKKILSAIDEASQSCRGVSQRIWELNESGQQEVKSAALLKEELANEFKEPRVALKAPVTKVKEGK